MSLIQEELAKHSCFEWTETWGIEGITYASNGKEMYPVPENRRESPEFQRWQKITRRFNRTKKILYKNQWKLVYEAGLKFLSLIGIPAMFD